MTRTWLWLERALVVVGAGLLLWCLVVFTRGYYYSRLPVPSPPPTASAPASPEPRPVIPARSETGAWLAKLEAPSVRMTVTVLEGSDEATLGRAAGHIEETALPGATGNVGLAGHRDTVFRPLRRIKVGDQLTLTTQDQIFHYQVSATSIVNPSDVYVLAPTEQPTLTLVTCYPFAFIGHAPRRFIVRATLVGVS